MTNKRDIVFRNEELKAVFNFRVAGIFLANNKILLEKAKDASYWSLIGGRVKYLENTEDAFIREVMEETGVLLKKDEIHLIEIIENFFENDGKEIHEILFIYKVENNEELINKDEFKTLDNEDTTNKWVDLNELDNYYIVPLVVKNCYKNNFLEHLIIDESK